MASPFQTPANERSFSSLVDEAIVMVGRPGSLLNAVSYANLTIRECQAFGLFARDLIEDSVPIDADPFIWTRPTYFRSLRTAKYVNAKVYPKFKLPGRQQNNETEFFYAADDYYVFSGGQIGDTLALATYYWAKPLTYYARKDANSSIYPGGPYATRPAYFDVALDKWQYLNAAGDTYLDTTTDPDGGLLRRQNASNWLVDEWRELILSGTKAKLFTQTGDGRAPVEYSLYKTTQTTLRNSVGSEAEGF